MGRIRTIGWGLVLGLWATSATAQGAPPRTLPHCSRWIAKHGNPFDDISSGSRRYLRAGISEEVRRAGARGFGLETVLT